MPISSTTYHRSQHLTEADLLPLSANNTACAFCDSTQLETIWTLQREPLISLRQCRQCSATGASRTPTEAALTNYYSTYYSSGTGQPAYTLGAPNKLAARIAEQFHGDLKQPIRILDFGGGDGTIAYLLAVALYDKGAMNIAITVVDYEDRTIPSDNSQITITKKKNLDELSGETFTIVIASAVIEHYPKPKELLIKLLESVSTGGLFYARTPYMLPLMKALEPLGIRLDFTFPAHLYDLGQHFWARIFPLLAPQFDLAVSRPSIVETSFSTNFVRTLIAHALKLPWYFLRGSYGLVGGWEVYAIKKAEKRQ